MRHPANIALAGYHVQLDFHMQRKLQCCPAMSFAMFSFITLGYWDLALLVGVSLQATAVAYLHNPKHKSAAMTLPIPFTVASLALGIQINATHVLGMLNLLIYTHMVRLLHDKAKLPIIPSIVVGIVIYIAVGVTGQRWIPVSEPLFWVAAGFNMVLGLSLHFSRSHAAQQGHRSPLPLHVKLPAIMGVVTFLIIIKRLLGGFAATFPMVGTIASYEMRHCLSAACQSVTLMFIVVTPYQITCHLLQDSIGLGPALACGWLAWAVMAAMCLPGYLKHRAIVDVVEPEPA